MLWCSLSRRCWLLRICCFVQGRQVGTGLCELSIWPPQCPPGQMLTLQQVQISDLQGRPNKPLCCNPFVPHIIKLWGCTHSPHTRWGLNGLHILPLLSGRSPAWLWVSSWCHASQCCGQKSAFVIESHVDNSARENTVKPQESFDADTRQVFTK